MKLVKAFGLAALICSVTLISFNAEAQRRQQRNDLANNNATVTLTGDAAKKLYNVLGVFTGNNSSVRRANLVSCVTNGSLPPEFQSVSCSVKVKSQVLEIGETLYEDLADFLGDEATYALNEDVLNAVLSGTANNVSLTEMLVGNDTANSVYNVTCSVQANRAVSCTGTRYKVAR